MPPWHPGGCIGRVYGACRGGGETDGCGGRRGRPTFSPAAVSLAMRNSRSCCSSACALISPSRCNFRYLPQSRQVRDMVRHNYSLLQLLPPGVDGLSVAQVQ